MAVEAWDGSDINLKPQNIAPLNTPIFPVWWMCGLYIIITFVLLSLLRIWYKVSLYFSSF